MARVGPNDQSLVCITPAQRKLHMTAEAFAVFAVAPFTLWVASQQTGIAKLGLYAIGLGTLAVDGYLLAKYAANRPGGLGSSAPRTTSRRPPRLPLR